MDAKELFKEKMGCCPVITGACGFFKSKEGHKQGTCWKTGAGVDVRTIVGDVRAYRSTGRIGERGS